LEIIDSIVPHPMSDYGPNSFGFQTIARSVRQVWGGSDSVIVSPGMLALLLISRRNAVNYIAFKVSAIIYR